MFICILTVHDNTQKNWGKKKKKEKDKGCNIVRKI